MAIIAIIVIVLFAAAVAGHFFVKKERRKQVEKRQQRVKIAEGDFDAIPVEAPKRKLFQRKRLELAPLVIAEKQAKEITDGLPDAVARTLESIALYKEKYTAACTAAGIYDDRKGKLSAFRFNAENGAIDTAALSNLHRNVEEAASSHDAKETEARYEHSHLRNHLRNLQQFVAAARGYDLSPLSKDVVKLLGVAEALAEANPNERHTASRSIYQRGEVHMLAEDEDVKRQANDLVTTEMTAHYLEAMGQLWEPVRALQLARKAIVDATAHLDVCNKATPSDGPDKPSDQDVAQYTKSVFDWVESVNDAEDKLAEAHGQLRQALTALEPLLVRAAQAGKAADHVSLGRGRYHRSPALKAASHALHVVSKLGEECRAYLPAPAAQAEGGVQAQALGAEDEARLTASIKAAVRKLGFAVAQENAAGQRGLSLQEKGPPQVKADEPTVEAGDADAYLRQFQKWDGAVKAHEVELAAHQQKIIDTDDAINARTAQVGPVVEQLHTILEGIDPNAVISPEFDTCIRAATWLAEKNEAYLK